MESVLIVYVIVFAGVVLLIEGIYRVTFGKSISLDQRMSRRMALLEKHGNKEQALDQLRKEAGQHLNAASIPLYSILAKKAQQANIAFSPLVLLGIMLGVTILAFVGLTVGTGTSPQVRAVMALVAGVGGVYFWVNKKAKKRMALLEEQLPDAVELIVRSLRVGHPFNASLGIVAKEIPDPIGTEFGLISDEAAYGRDVSESLEEFAERVDNQDLRFLAVAVSIQQQSGGNLAEILHGLSQVIRARFKLFRRVRAITAEAKWSGMFLSAFPALALGMILMIKPDYFDQVQESALFTPVAIGVFAMLVVNVIFMKIMVNIKV
ncbi:type II secretion system F family protein [Gemmobacter serpentinus]|uniref:type II secretion system F family protein n=1 Tax=Gemmobacter serpentinus TaxID=2652247 RepID=UPI00124EFB96|nr:type II secretion system F family protein [Gemmobacter serpentinus]